jgi:pimeloyl-ACP methyl ester carboxylesterase
MKVKASSAVCGNHHVRFVRAAAAVSCTLLLGACATDPTALFSAHAERGGLEAGTVEGAGFRHRLYARAPGHAAPDPSTLHIYYGGDGSPFIAGRHIARDPTPRRPLILDLMQQDPFSAVYLGRPCYHGLMTGCDAALWTVARYSPAVVDSMVAATTTVIDARDPERVVLVGYSGGGALAVLVAERLQRIDAVVTVAANLDLTAWTTHHGYTPLHDSIDPADEAGSRPGLNHLHLSGSDDDNVPPATQQRALEKLPPGAARTLIGFDHRCCWVAAWAELMIEFEAGSAAVSRESR